MPLGAINRDMDLFSKRRVPAQAPAPHLLPKARISIGEIKSSAQPFIVQTVLGSCVAVCLRDPVSGVGGMNHILLPGGSSKDQSSRFGIHAMELLINEMMSIGADRRRLTAKAFGAGNVLSCLQPPTVGELNAHFVRKFLAAENIPLLAQRLGGDHAVQVSFRTDTGGVTVRTVDGSPLSAVVAEEEKYSRGKGRYSSPKDDDTTLF